MVHDILSLARRCFVRFSRKWPLLLVAPLLLAISCDVANVPEPPLRVLAVADGLARRIVAEAISVGLTARDAEGRVIPGLAQSWRVSDDGMFIIFRLRGAHYSDGRPLLASDVVATIEQARRAPGLTRELLAGVAGVSAPLANVVELRLTTPQPEILELLASPPLGIRAGRRSMVRAGAFVGKVAETGGEDSDDVADSFELRANPLYFAADSVKLDTALVQQSNAGEAIAAFRRGEADMVVGGGLHRFAELRAARMVSSLEPARAALLLLVNQNEGALADPRVRRALSLSVRRAVLGPALFASAAAVPISGLAPPGVGLNTRFAWDELPLESRRGEARWLLAEAGVELPLKLAVAIGSIPEEQRLVEIIAADLAAVDIELSIVRRSARGHAKAIADGDFSLALVRHESPIASPLPFLLPFRCDANRHGVCLPEADRLLAEAWNAADAGERLAAYATAERLWAEDGAAIGLMQPLSWSLLSPRVVGFTPTITGVHRLESISLLSD